MNTRKVIEKARKFGKPFRVTNGQKFRLKDIDPGDTLGLKSEDKPRTTEELVSGIQALRGAAGQALCAGQMGRSGDFSGHGRRR